MPSWRAGSGRIEDGAAASLRRDTPAGERARQPASLVAGEEKAGGAARLRRETETPGDERRLDLDLAESGDEGAALQSLFQRPGSVQPVARLDDEDKSRVEAEGEQARTIGRAPFARGSLGQAPEQWRGGAVSPGQAIADKGERKGKRRRCIAIGGRLDLMQPRRGEPAPGRRSRVCDFSTNSPSPLVGEGREGGESQILSLRFTPLRSAKGRSCSPTKGERAEAGSLGGKKGAGGARQRSRIRRGGEGQRHGNLLEHANTLTQVLDETFAACPACSFNASRQKFTDVFAAWNVVTHGHKTPNFVPVLF